MESYSSPKDLSYKSDLVPTVKSALRSHQSLNRVTNDSPYSAKTRVVNGQSKSPTHVSTRSKGEIKCAGKSKSALKIVSKDYEERKKEVVTRTKSVSSAKKQLKVVDSSIKPKDNTPDGYKIYLDKCDRDILSKYATFPRKKVLPFCDEKCDDIMTRSTASSSECSPKSPSVWDRLSAKSTIGSSNKIKPKVHEKLDSRPSSNISSPSVLLLDSFTQTSLTASSMQDVPESDLPEYKQVVDPLSITCKSASELLLLENKLKRLNEEHSRLQAEHARLRQALLDSETLRHDLEKAHENILENERQARGEVEAELDQTSQRVELVLKSMEDVEQELEDHGLLKDKVLSLQETNELLQKDLKSCQVIITSLKQDVDKSLAAQKTLCQQLQETEAESRELTEFIEQERKSLTEELEMQKSQLEESQRECERLASLLDSSRQELCSIKDETQSLLIEQGADMSSTAISVHNLSNRVQQFLKKILESNGPHDYLSYWEGVIPDNGCEDGITSCLRLSEQVIKLNELVGQLIRTMQSNTPMEDSLSDNKENLNCNDIPILKTKIIQLEEQLNKLQEENMKKEQIQDDLKKSSLLVEELKERYSRNQRIMHERLQKTEKECRQMDHLLHKVTAAFRSASDVVESTPMLSRLWLELGDGPLIPKQLDKNHILTINGEEATYV